MEIQFKLADKDSITAILEMMADFNAIDDCPFDEKVAKLNIAKFISTEHLGRLWLVLHENAIIGYLALTFGFSFEYGGRDAFIDELFIEEGYRGKGIGDQVMRYIELEAQSLAVNAIHLEVEEHNVKGNRLYIKRGFQGSGRSLLTKKIRIRV